MNKKEKIGVVAAMSMGVLYVPLLSHNERLMILTAMNSSAGITSILKTLTLSGITNPDVSEL